MCGREYDVCLKTLVTWDFRCKIQIQVKKNYKAETSHTEEKVTFHKQLTIPCWDDVIRFRRVGL